MGCEMMPDYAIDRRLVWGWIDECLSIATFSQLVLKRSMSGNRVFVFIEDDGMPWINGRCDFPDLAATVTVAFDFML